MSPTLHAQMLPSTYLCYLLLTPLPMPLMPFKKYNYSVSVLYRLLSMRSTTCTLSFSLRSSRGQDVFIKENMPIYKIFNIYIYIYYIILRGGVGGVKTKWQ